MMFSPLTLTHNLTQNNSYLSGKFELLHGCWLHAYCDWQLINQVLPSWQKWNQPRAYHSWWNPPAPPLMSSHTNLGGVPTSMQLSHGSVMCVDVWRVNPARYATYLPLLAYRIPSYVNYLSLHILGMPYLSLIHNSKPAKLPMGCYQLLKYTTAYACIQLNLEWLASEMHR